MEAQYSLPFDLQRFAEGGGGAGGEGAPAAGGSGAPDGKPAVVQYGKAPQQAEQAAPLEQRKDTQTIQVEQPTAQERKAAFEALIKGEYKDLFAERTQQIINDRFRQTKGLETQLQQLEPVLQLLSQRYGVDAKDSAALAKAVEEDDSYYEQEAADKDLTVAQLKEFKRMERENAQFRRTEEERARQENADRILSGWMQQSEQVKQTYGSFDLRSEINDPETGERFLGLLKSGVDVKTAYEVIHKDDIIGGAMQYTAQQVEKRTVDAIRARGMRPQENGGSSAAAVIRKTDPKSFTRKDREEISRRVLRGERIEL